MKGRQYKGRKGRGEEGEGGREAKRGERGRKEKGEVKGLQPPNLELCPRPLFLLVI
jgi:hypothetical protein